MKHSSINVTPTPELTSPDKSSFLTAVEFGPAQVGRGKEKVPRIKVPLPLYYAQRGTCAGCITGDWTVGMRQDVEVDGEVNSRLWNLAFCMVTVKNTCTMFETSNGGLV